MTVGIVGVIVTGGRVVGGGKVGGETVVGVKGVVVCHCCETGK